MKKNAMLKIAAILMVAVLLTTCAISSTFAKYVSTDKADASARVAKWGVDLSVEANSFAESYGSAKVLSENAASATVDNVVAPGTECEDAVVITATGTSEVATAITFKDSKKGNKFVTLENWKVTTETGEVEYCPVVFTLTVREENEETKDDLTDYKDTEYVFTHVTGESVQDFEDDINETIATVFAGGYAAGDALNQSLIIDWAWAFETNNTYDTLLGENAFNGNAAKINFDFVVSIEQAGTGNFVADPVN